MARGAPAAVSLAAAALLLAGASGGVDAELSHGIVFDAGSSGSRIHIYTWRGGGPSSPFELVEDDVHKTKPGLSAFAGAPWEAGGSLSELLARAEAKVPQERHSQTPMYLMASAGLRLLEEDSSRRILESVRDRLAASPFLFRREWAYIMTGKDEGLFGWVAVNYLLGTLGGSSGRTQGVIDLGGGSVQVAFAAPAGAPVAEEHACEASFGSQRHSLYCRSHLGFGLDEARKRAAHALRGLRGEAEAAAGEVDHPCLPMGHRLPQQPATGAAEAAQQAFVGTGSYDECASLYARLFDEQGCRAPPCALDAAQPGAPGAALGFSYLYDRTGAIGLLDGAPMEFGSQNTTLASLRAAGRELCAMAPREAEARFASCEDSAHWANFCGDVAYMVTMMELGLGIASDQPLTVANKLGDVELVWTLGAVIAKSSELASGGVRDEL